MHVIMANRHGRGGLSNDVKNLKSRQDVVSNASSELGKAALLHSRPCLVAETETWDAKSLGARGNDLEALNGEVAASSFKGRLVKVQLAYGYQGVSLEKRVRESCRQGVGQKIWVHPSPREGIMQRSRKRS